MELMNENADLLKVNEQNLSEEEQTTDQIDKYPDELEDII